MQINPFSISNAHKMVDYAMANGYNYFDTAYVYDNGRSEETIKETIVKRYPREDFYLASKLPAWKMETLEDRDRILNESMERMGVDYIDFYLLHSVEDGSHADKYEAFDCYNWALEKKKEGKIKHFGFSFHGTPKLLEEVLDKHPEVEFVQIQLNYADWDNPVVEAGELYKILKERNIPIIVMEPVKGGSLAEPEPKIKELLAEVDSNANPASLALRFVGSLGGITTILSGMSSLEQMEENVNTFNNFIPLSEEQQQKIELVREEINSQPTVACTACSYCTENCPVNMNIPLIIKAVNAERLYPNSSRNRFFYNTTITNGSGRASECIACAQCEGVCPQHLPIVEILQEAASNFDNN